jgi:hypothetical protein
VKILVLPGDGIGPEVVQQARNVLEACARRFGFQLAFTEAIIGGAAIDAFHTALPDGALHLAQASDAVLLGAVGGPKWDNPRAAVRPEQALLGLRKALGLFANLRPVRVMPELLETAPLKADIVRDVDLVVVRELTGGLYFGKPSEQRRGLAGREGVDTLLYTEVEVARLMRVAFALARTRRKKVTSVDKANMLSSSRLWREVAHEVRRDLRGDWRSPAGGTRRPRPAIPDAKRAPHTLDSRRVANRERAAYHSPASGWGPAPMTLATHAHAVGRRNAPRVSIVMEWANAHHHGTERALRLLNRLGGQWDEAIAGTAPSLSAEEAAFLRQLDPRAELLLVAAHPPGPALAPELRSLLDRRFDVQTHVAPGLDYYPLKNHGADLATGDIILFVDSDVLPEEHWLAQLLAPFARSDVEAVCGQTYVTPTDWYTSAMALSWMFPLRDDRTMLAPAPKVFSNNLAYRAGAFRFPPLGLKTRIPLRREFERAGVTVWQNPRARLDHPAPPGVRAAIVRALAQGRDAYMVDSEARSWSSLAGALRTGVSRMFRGAGRALSERRRVGLSRAAALPVIAIICGYYSMFLLGVLLTHASPRGMGRRWRM